MLSMRCAMLQRQACRIRINQCDSFTYSPLVLLFSTEKQRMCQRRKCHEKKENSYGENLHTLSTNIMRNMWPSVRVTRCFPYKICIYLRKQIDPI